MGLRAHFMKLFNETEEGYEQRVWARRRLWGEGDGRGQGRALLFLQQPSPIIPLTGRDTETEP